MINRISKKRLVGVVNLTIKESFAHALIKNTTPNSKQEKMSRGGRWRKRQNRA
jgi:hypothetical protein